MADIPRVSYTVISGWYADHKQRQYPTYGSDFVRSAACFDIWYHCVNRFTSPTKILIVDSASPIRPTLPADPRIEWVSLSRNFGHTTEARSFHGGWSRSLLAGLVYGYANGDPYTVLIEQGTLFYGNDIIERQINRYPDADVIAPDGAGTPQPIGTGILIFRTSAIPHFIERYTAVPEADHTFDPERKTVLAGGESRRI